MKLQFAVISVLLSLFICPISYAQFTNSTCPSMDKAGLDDYLEQIATRLDDLGNHELQFAILHHDDLTFNMLADELSGASAFRSFSQMPDPKQWHCMPIGAKIPHIVDQILSHPNNDQNTALHLATLQGSFAMASRLLDIPSEADLLSLRNKAQDTPLHVATHLGDLDLVNLFLMHHQSKAKPEESECQQFGLFGGTRHPLLNLNGATMTILDIAVVNSNNKMIEFISKFIEPISKRCNIPFERFMMYSKKLDFVLQAMVPYLQNKESRPLKMNERYLFEDVQGLKYLTSEELKEHRLLAVNGYLFARKKGINSPFACYPHFIYALSQEGELFVGCDVIGRFHHSSFFNGKDVLGAGHLTVKDGKLESIDGLSGHYLPSIAHLVQTVLKLYDKGIAHDGTTVTFSSLSSGFSIHLGELLEHLSRRHGLEYKSVCISDNIPRENPFEWSSLMAPSDVCVLRSNIH